MGLFSKVWKGLKKTVKKIGKGIKKVFKKVGAAIGKLGIVGQIGMMFLMPYAAGALGSFFGATGKLATWSTKLLGKAGMGSKALGHTLNLVNKAGTFVGNAYNSISQTISGAIDKTGNFLKGRGYVSTDTLNQVGQSIANIDTSKISVGDENFNLFDKDGKLILDTNKPDVFKIDTKGIKFDAQGMPISKTTNILDMGTQDFQDYLTSKESLTRGLEIAVDKGMITDTDSLLNKINTPLSSPPSNMIDNIIDKGQDYIESELKGGAKALAKQETLKAFGVEQSTGDYNSYNINLPGVIDRSDNVKTFEDLQFALAPTGNNFLSSNIQNTNALNGLIDNSNSYKQHMSQFAGGMYSFG